MSAATMDRHGRIGSRAWEGCAEHGCGERPADCDECGCYDNAHEWSFVQAALWCHSCGRWCNAGNGAL